MNAPKGEETIFAEALRLPPEERDAYLAQATAGHPELRQEVESLLHGYASGGFLEVAAASDLRPTLHVSVPVTEKPGHIIGRYKLLQQIGEGGCGVVYMAEQAEPVRRRVALKIIKLGMDTSSVIARFEAERQALALMDHPNIAKVFDAGATETGRPYFVMELVRGLKITEFCDEKRLSTKQRLDLFMQVCQAIQHAHQKGIIHRDIKPSNILVSVNDGVMAPKVIDFGIAKATSGQQLTDKTLFTAFEQFIGTPAYMSPEQAMITNVDIDTRSDIYALGVLLYELLTGGTPFDAKALLAIGLDEMRRAICEQEPPRPSTHLSTLGQNELSTTAQRRGLDAPKLVSELRGDLDWIVMKAMEKDRARRYETANGLAADIQRHLNNEPVVACPPSRLYRFGKTVRRNRVAFAAGAAVLLALAIGLTFSTASFLREHAARQHAHEQTAIAQAVNEFLQQDLLRQASSYSQADAHFTPDPNLTVRQALERAAERIGDRFKAQPLQEAAVRMAIGEALFQVGEAERASPQLERALELRRDTVGPRHADTLTSMHYLANCYRLSGKFDKALALFEETFRLRQATLPPDHPDTLTSMGFLGNAYLNAGRLKEALPLLEHTLELRKSKFGMHHDTTIRAIGALANAYYRGGKKDQALALQQEILKLRMETSGTSHPETLLAMGNLAGSYSDAGQFEEAFLLLKRVLEGRQATLGTHDPETLAAMFSLATTCSKAGKLDEARSLFEQTLALQREKLPLNHPDTLHTMNNLGIVYARLGNLDQAVPLLEDTLRLIRTKADWDPQHADFTRHNLEDAYRLAGNLDKLEAMFRERVSLPGIDGLKAKVRLANVLLEKASKTNHLGRQQELNTSGEQLLREYLAGVRARYTNDPVKLATRLYDAAEVSYRRGKYAEAEPLYREVRELRRRVLSEEHNETLDATATLARLLSDWAWAQRDANPEVENPKPAMTARAAEAERLLRKVLDWRARENTNSWRVGEVRSRLGGALVSLAVTDATLDRRAREAKLSEAEGLLLEGYESVRVRSDDEKYVRDALERINRLYQAWNKPDKAAEWQHKVKLFEKGYAKPSVPENLFSGNPKTNAKGSE